MPHPDLSHTDFPLDQEAEYQLLKFQQFFFLYGQSSLLILPFKLVYSNSHTKAKDCKNCPFTIYTWKVYVQTQKSYIGRAFALFEEIQVQWERGENPTHSISN